MNASLSAALLDWYSAWRIAQRGDGPSAFVPPVKTVSTSSGGEPTSRRLPTDPARTAADTMDGEWNGTGWAVSEPGDSPARGGHDGQV